MKTGILLFEQVQGKKDIGSSRIRGHWIVKHWKDAGVDLGEAEIFKHGGNYDAVIYQKAYFIEHAKDFQGIKIFDICDPDWLDWGYRFKEMIELCDAITCSSRALAAAIGGFTNKPVYFVPDRVDLDSVIPPKIHKGDAKIAVWYGYSHNFPALMASLPALAKRGLSLIVISDDVFTPPANSKVSVTNYPWSQHWMADIQRGDIVINPQMKKGRWKYKSDNKTSISRALGMPVAHTDEELDQLITEAERARASVECLRIVKEHYDVRLSVVDYKDIIQAIVASKDVVSSANGSPKDEKAGAA